VIGQSYTLTVTSPANFIDMEGPEVDGATIQHDFFVSPEDAKTNLDFDFTAPG
jgi:hypothetical protein